MDDPMLQGTSVEEARLYHDIVRKHGRLPEGLKRIEFRFGEDSTASSAVWIVLVAEEDVNPSKDKIAGLRRVADEIRSEILASDSQRWPYVEIVTE
jgi:hypothetical protein